MRPDRVFSVQTQHERTSLGWERTAFSALAVSLLLTRVGADVHLAFGVLGLMHVCAAAVLLVWTGRHYDGLHAPLRAGISPIRTRGVAAAGGLATSVIVSGLVVAMAAIAGAT